MIIKKLIGNLVRSRHSYRTYSDHNKPTHSSLTDACIFGQKLPPPKSSRNKVSIIGSGRVGEALLAILLYKKITGNIALVGRDRQKLNEIVLDFQQSKYVDGMNIQCSDDYSVTANSHVCVMTVGIPRKSGETRMDGLKTNSEMLSEYVPKLAKYAPESIIIIVSNPVDTLTYFTAKLTGFPKHKVFGSGTSVDTARLRFFMSQKYGVGAESCKGWVLGEHGETAVTAYSTCTVGGTFIGDVNERMGESGDVDSWSDVHQSVLRSGLTVSDIKGYTNWAVALCTAEMIRSILNNRRGVFAVSTSAQGFFGITEDVYLSLPAVLGENGIVEVLRLPLAESECKKVRKSAEALSGFQKRLKL